jgi:formamidase
MHAATLFLVGCWGSAWADTSDVKLSPPVIVAKTGKHCKDDPHCFNRYHYAIKPSLLGSCSCSRHAMRSIPT